MENIVTTVFGQQNTQGLDNYRPINPAVFQYKADTLPIDNTNLLNVLNQTANTNIANRKLEADAAQQELDTLKYELEKDRLKFYREELGYKKEKLDQDFISDIIGGGGSSGGSSGGSKYAPTTSILGNTLYGRNIENRMKAANLEKAVRIKEITSMGGGISENTTKKIDQFEKQHFDKYKNLYDEYSNYSIKRDFVDSYYTQIAKNSKNFNPDEVNAWLDNVDITLNSPNADITDFNNVANQANFTEFDHKAFTIYMRNARTVFRQPEYIKESYLADDGLTKTRETTRNKKPWEYALSVAAGIVNNPAYYEYFKKENNNVPLTGVYEETTDADGNIVHGDIWKIAKTILPEYEYINEVANNIENGESRITSIYNPGGTSRGTSGGDSEGNGSKIYGNDVSTKAIQKVRNDKVTSALINTFEDAAKNMGVPIDGIALQEFKEAVKNGAGVEFIDDYKNQNGILRGRATTQSIFNHPVINADKFAKVEVGKDGKTYLVVQEDYANDYLRKLGLTGNQYEKVVTFDRDAKGSKFFKGVDDLTGINMPIDAEEDYSIFEIKINKLIQEEPPKKGKADGNSGGDNNNRTNIEPTPISTNNTTGGVSTLYQVPTVGNEVVIVGTDTDGKVINYIPNNIYLGFKEKNTPEHVFNSKYPILISNESGGRVGIQSYYTTAKYGKNTYIKSKGKWILPTGDGEPKIITDTELIDDLNKVAKREPSFGFFQFNRDVGVLQKFFDFAKKQLPDLSFPNINNDKEVEDWFKEAEKDPAFFYIEEQFVYETKTKRVAKLVEKAGYGKYMNDPLVIDLLTGAFNQMETNTQTAISGLKPGLSKKEFVLEFLKLKHEAHSVTYRKKEEPRYLREKKAAEKYFDYVDGITFEVNQTSGTEQNTSKQDSIKNNVLENMRNSVNKSDTTNTTNTGSSGVTLDNINDEELSYLQNLAKESGLSDEEFSNFLKNLPKDTDYYNAAVGIVNYNN